MDNEKLLHFSLDYAIKIYLRQGEDKDDMISSFQGDKVKLVQFLRKREFSGLKKEPEAVSPIVTEAEAPANIGVKPEIPVQPTKKEVYAPKTTSNKNNRSVAKQSDNNSQGTLF